MLLLLVNASKFLHCHTVKHARAPLLRLLQVLLHAVRHSLLASHLFDALHRHLVPVHAVDEQVLSVHGVVGCDVEERVLGRLQTSHDDDVDDMVLRLAVEGLHEVDVVVFPDKLRMRQLHTSSSFHKNSVPSFIVADEVQLYKDWLTKNRAYGLDSRSAEQQREAGVKTLKQLILEQDQEIKRLGSMYESRVKGDDLAF